MTQWINLLALIGAYAVLSFLWKAWQGQRERERQIKHDIETARLNATRDRMLAEERLNA